MRKAEEEEQKRLAEEEARRLSKEKKEKEIKEAKKKSDDVKKADSAFANIRYIKNINTNCCIFHNVLCTMKERREMVAACRSTN